MREPTPEEIKRFNEKIIKETQIDFENFRNTLKQGLCPICNEKLTSFTLTKPCMHWLLKPSGFEKKYFPLVYKIFDYFRIDPYLRWLVNSETPFKNINDIENEQAGDKIIESTIKYKNLEWSFSCSRSDLRGHFFSISGRKPHYHFQMRIDNLPFIDYSDYHIPFTDYDLWSIDIKQGKHKYIKHVELYDMGMGGAIKEIKPEDLLSSMKNIEDEKQSTFHLSTIIMAEPGKTISGDKLAELIDKSKRTRVPMAKLAQELSEARIQTIITPGEGVPDPAYRKKQHRKKKEKPLPKRII